MLDYLNVFRMDLKDLIEIVLVAYLIYRILLIYSGTRAFQIMFGFVVLVTVYALAQALQLGLITYILSQVFTYGAFALIVVFQPELRTALAQLGRTRWFRAFTRLEEKEVVDEIVKAADRLSRAKIGAIIAIEREVELADFVDQGTPVNAEVSAELLATIFTPYSPLHDGAVIVKRKQILYAGSIVLRLSESPVVDRSLGTRHRAALGLSEETDALVVVVSEETGQLSLAHRGQLFRGLRPEELGDRLSTGGEPGALPESVPVQTPVADAQETPAAAQAPTRHR